MKSDNDAIVEKGALAKPGTPCPYGMSDMRERHLWLAGHYDQHGLKAWEEAKK